MNNELIKRYGNNCISIGTKVYSYETHVADISGNLLKELGKWSRTTSKHVRMVADELNLILVKYS